MLSLQKKSSLQYKISNLFENATCLYVTVLILMYQNNKKDKKVRRAEQLVALIYILMDEFAAYMLFIS
jgi:hypothetical protein